MTRQPRYQNSGGSKLLFVSEIILLGACFYGAATIDLDIDPTMYFLYEGGLERFLFAAGTIMLALYFHHLYSDVRVRSRVVLIEQLCEVFGIALVAQSLIVYIKPDWILPRWLMIYGALFSLLAIFLWRVFYSQFVLNLVRRHRIVFVGRNPTVLEIAQEIANTPGWGYEVLGFVSDDESAKAQEGATGKWLGPSSGLAPLARKLRPDRIVVGLEDRRNTTPIQALLDLHYEGLAIEEAGQTYESVSQRVSLRDLGARDLIFSGDLTPTANALGLQRFFDRLVTFFLLLISLPLMAIVAAGLRVLSKEPVFVRSRRVGYHGREFDMLRFRKPAGKRSIYARWHLDALPELLHVMTGEMSLVGPRAATPEANGALSREIALYDYRLNVPPGMTGWAQINLTLEEQERDPLGALEFDLYYIKHRSQTLNFYILMTTLKNRLVWGDLRP